MRQKLLTLIISLLFVSGVIKLHGQQSVLTTGGEASGGGGSVSYSVGQVSCQYYSGTNGSVSEGVQQAYVISSETSIKEVEGISLSMSVYPNPTSEMLSLKIDRNELDGLAYMLIDLNGKIVQHQKIVSGETVIPVGDLAPSTYFLKVCNNNNELKTFRIIKN